MSSSDLFLQHLNSYLDENKKRVYLDKMSTVPNIDAPLISLIPHNQSYLQDVTRWKVDFGTIDGVSYGTIEDAGDAEIREATVTMKKMFQTIKLDRFSMKITEDPRAAAINFLKDGLRKASYERMLSLESALIGGDSIGTVSSVVDNGSGSYTITVTAASWAYGQFRVRMMLNFGSSTDLFRITDIDEDNRKFTCLRDSGLAYVPAASDVVYRQKAKNNLSISLNEVIEGSSSLHGIARRHGWRSTKFDLSSGSLNKPITEGILLELMMKVFQRSGEYPDLLVLSPTQMVKVQNLARDSQIRTAEAYATRTLPDGEKKVFPVPSITHLNIMGREVKLVAHAHMAAGSGYFVNTRHLELASVGPGEFVSPVQGASGSLLYMGAITKADHYEMVWAYDYAFKVDSPIYHGGFINASSSLEETTF